MTKSNLSTRKVCNGNEADYDDNDKDEDENNDEYNYDNEYYAQYQQGQYGESGSENNFDENLMQTSIKMTHHETSLYVQSSIEQPISIAARTNDVTKLLNNTTSSAYDTCSNLSNEISSSLSCTNSCKNSDRLSSGNASGGDYSLNDYLKNAHNDSLNDSSGNLYDNLCEHNQGGVEYSKSDELRIDEPTTLDQSASSRSNPNDVSNANPNLVIGVDETSTTNTDVSDPHWDGYTVYIELVN